MPTPRNHDEYLAALPADQRQVLQALRQTIRELAPHAEETISYQICAFRDGVMLVGYGATPKHCAFFLMSNQTTKTHAADLKGYDLSTGTVRFQPDRPLPAALVQKLVRARQAENAARLGSKTKPAAAKKAAPKATASRSGSVKSPSAKRASSSKAAPNTGAKPAGKKPAVKKTTSAKPTTKRAGSPGAKKKPAAGRKKPAS